MSKPALVIDRDRDFELSRITKSIKDGEDGAINCPPFWSGFRVAPEQIEFWHGKPYRRHHRILYVRTADGWQTQFLYP